MTNFSLPISTMPRKNVVFVTLIALSCLVMLFQLHRTVQSNFIANTHWIKQGCYAMQGAVPESWKLLTSDVLKKYNCSKHSPEVLIIGAKKCGTTTLRNFLGFHPNVAVVHSETHFFTSRYYLGLEWYYNQMPYSKVDQITIEKTPRYLVYPNTVERVNRHLGPNIRLIVILCDPVKRSVSDYLHVHLKAILESGGNVKKDIPVNLTKEEIRRRKQNKNEFHDANPATYNLSETFESSVVDSEGQIKSSDAVIDTGIYVKYIKKWLKFYPRESFIFLDGEEMIVNPALSLKRVESFLNLPPYFNQNHFYFDNEKGFYCLAYPLRSCMGISKGRPHPQISQNVWFQLKDFFKPYNHELVKIINQTFTWRGIDENKEQHLRIQFEELFRETGLERLTEHNQNKKGNSQ